MSELTYGIVIPVYKANHTLKQCLDSLLEQKYKDKRILCVLDGPDEKAVKIISEYGEKVSHIVLDKRSGAPHARNAGRKALNDTTDLLLFWDADCLMQPGALQDWANVLKKNPDVDFVYSDYRFMVAEMGAVIGEEFDPWLLKCNNYISTMTPVRTKADPVFDESLESLQDWDLWLTLAERGHKGRYLPGVRFVTSPPDIGSISGKGCSPDNWLNRKDIIRRKHNIRKNPVCFVSLSCPERAMELAKQAGNADFSRDPSFNRHEYSMVYLLGFYAQDAMNHASVFRNGPSGMKKVIHWLGSDVAALYQLVPMQFGFQLGEVIGREYINFCETARMKTMLKKIGIDAEIMKLPVNLTDIPETRPDKFKVLYDSDDEYKKLLKLLVSAMPDISFTEFTKADIADYSLFIRLSSSGILDEACKKFLCSDRRLISNIAEPYAGYIADAAPETMMKNLAAAVRSAKIAFENGTKDKSAEQSAEYYHKILSWDNFKDVLGRILDKGLLWKTEEQEIEQEKPRTFLSFCRHIMRNVL